MDGFILLTYVTYKIYKVTEKDLCSSQNIYQYFIQETPLRKDTPQTQNVRFCSKIYAYRREQRIFARVRGGGVNLALNPPSLLKKGEVFNFLSLK